MWEGVGVFFSALPVGLLLEGPPSSWGLHASICLCACSTSVECTAFPWVASPEPPPRLSTRASGPPQPDPSRDLPPWTKSVPLLDPLWGSARGGAVSPRERWSELFCSSSSGMGLYQISPSSSASFSSAGSMLWGWGDTFAGLTLT